MKEKIKIIKRKKWYRFILIPSLLLLLWIVLTFLYILNVDTSLSVISYNHGKDNFDKLSYNKLLKGDKISGHFTARENNLGIVSIRFQTFIRPEYKNEDYLVFRMKEKGAKNWYYENKYRDGFIYEIPFLPFGFPKIANSKDKTYLFEVESLKGNANNSVALSRKNQILSSKYQVPKSLLLHDKKALIIFAAKKFINSIFTTDVRFSSFIYLLPFIYYLLWISPFRKKLITSSVKYLNGQSIYFIKPVIEYNLAYILIAIALIDIFKIQLTNDVIYLVIIGIWIIILRLYKLTSKTSFILALLLLIMPPIMLSFRDEATAEKAAIWAYIFLVAGTIQILIELRSEKHEKS